MALLDGRLKQRPGVRQLVPPAPQHERVVGAERRLWASDRGGDAHVVVNVSGLQRGHLGGEEVCKCRVNWPDVEPEKVSGGCGVCIEG